ncbi:MAG: Arm DNA-binding domain-containing protein [Clostridia bacterium]|nr:Arm DNA-binding domain-containing protein [Clostridia bacterium]
MEIADGSLFCNWCGAKQSAVLDRKKRSVKRRGNGQGTVFKRGKCWTIEVVCGWNADGKRIRKTKGGFSTKKEALEYIPKLRNQPATASRSLAYYYNSWSKSDLVKLSSSKQTAYRIAWNKLSDIHSMAISDLSIIRLRDIVNEVAPTYYPARDIKSLLSHLFKLAIADQQTTVNMSSYITLPKLDEKEQQPWNMDELAVIWNAFDNENVVAAYLLLMIYSGMMPGELCICTKGMVNLESRLISGGGLKTGIRKKTPIVIADVLIPVLDRIFTYTPESASQRILYTDRWTFYDDYHDFTREYHLRDLPMYSCRHTTATALAIGTDVAPSVIQKVMRHARFTTTQRYIHPDMADSISAVNKIQQPARPRNASTG